VGKTDRLDTQEDLFMRDALHFARV
jgi:hypothetical protein